MSKDHTRLQELFLAACDLPKAQQTAMVDEQCADDPDLRRELLLLLRTDARESGIFADDKTTDGIQFQLDAGVESKPPTHIGRYRVKRVLGEGGMGVVYLAEQQNPRREVAVKVIRSGLADKQTIARFEAERQALSMMDHPNIARVLDAGETDDGTPYFVMELVQGDPITKYCDMNKLALNRRLELFVQACEAIQHAHHKGIIHRDLKPSNMLVDIHNNKARVKVIDFGLAKALEHQTRLTDKTVFTEFGKVIGTAQYMSPEQARLDSVDIDTRTDIYSLGVVLYELLTGSTPLEKDTMQAHALLQVLEIIRDKDPPRPSDRLSSSLNNQDSISALRQIQPARLQQILRGELDWIIMRALEKDRTRRYASPHDFARDIRRYLNGEAVEARPPSGVYRLRKFVRKNRVPVGIFAGFLALVCGASIAVFSYAIKADASAKRSDAILQIVADSFQAVDPESGSDAQMSARDVLVEAYDGLNDSSLDNAGKRKFLAQLNSSFYAIGEYDLALQTAQRWRQLAVTELGAEHTNTLMAMNNLANCYQSVGQTAEAMKLWEQTLQLRQAKLGPEHPDTLYSMTNLACGYFETGQTTKAIKLFEETLRIRKAKLGPEHPDTLLTMMNLGSGYHIAGRTVEAMELLETTLQLRKATLGPDHPSTLFSMRNLASCYREAGQTAAATKLTEESLEIRKTKLGRKHPHTLDSMDELANCYSDAGQTAKAIKLYEQTLQLRTATLGAEHPDTLSSRIHLALDYRKTGRLADAIELDEGTLRLRQAKLGRDHPDTLTSMSNLTLGYCDVGRIEEAITLGRESLSLRQTKLGRDHPVTVKWMGEFVWILATTEGMENGIDEALLGDLRTACEGTEDGELLNRLALAEYRLENFEVAIDAANASIEKLPPPPGPINLALLAMSHLRLNHEPEASEFREAFQQAMQTEEYKDDSDCQKFTAEVEDLFGAREE